MLNFSPFARRWLGWPPSQSASGAGILRNRLYDLDRIIAAPYTLVTGLLIGIFAGPVLLATRVLSVHKPVAVAAATLAAAPEVNHGRRVGAARICDGPCHHNHQGASNVQNVGGHPDLPAGGYGEDPMAITERDRIR